MENLNKNQFILLVLLVSFVTSIATGIMTTSLLQQAPVEVTKTINQVVERTIQTVTPSGGILPTREVTTVVVKEEDQILSAISKNSKSIVRVNERTGLGEEFFYGIGVVVSSEGLIATVRSPIHYDSAYFGIDSDGNSFTLVPILPGRESNFITFKVKPEDSKKINITQASFSAPDPLLGQSIISVGGSRVNAVSVGRIVSLNIKDSTVGTTTTKYLSSIETDISPTKDIVSGSPLFNLSGDIVGIQANSNIPRTFTSSQILKKEMSSGLLNAIQ